MLPIVTVFCLLIAFANGNPVSYQQQRLIYTAPASEATPYQAPVPIYQPIGMSNYYATPSYQQKKSTYKRSIDVITLA